VRLFIPDQLTYALNNKCTWRLDTKDREIDSQNDIALDWEDSGTCIETTDPVLVPTQDMIMLNASVGLAASKVVFKVWVKEINLDVEMLNTSLVNIERTQPSGECLELLEGRYVLISNTVDYGQNREGWLFLTKTV